MGIFKRFGDLVRSNANAALDTAEDPRKVLEQTVLDMESEHKKARQKLLESMTLTKHTAKQAETYKQQGVEWEQKAMSALKAGNDELARAALTEKQKFDGMAAEAEAGVAAQAASTEQLKEQITMLEGKIQEAKRKRDELIMRLNAADMKKKASAAMNGGVGGGNAVGDTTAFDTFNRMAEKIEVSEAEGEARAEMLGSRAPEIDAELQKLSATQGADDALAALKAKMSTTTSSTPAATTAAAPTADAKASAIDDELAKLKAKLGG